MKSSYFTKPGTWTPGLFVLYYMVEFIRIQFKGVDKMESKTGTWIEKKGLAQMLKGGVIMDVVNAEQARIAEDAGACAVMALERVPCRYPCGWRRGAHV